MCSFGRGKLEAEAFVGDFRDVCVMQRLRVMGDDVRLYKCYPGDWQVRPRIGCHILPYTTLPYPTL